MKGVLTGDKGRTIGRSAETLTWLRSNSVQITESILSDEIRLRVSPIARLRGSASWAQSPCRFGGCFGAGSSELRTLVPNPYFG